MLIGYARVSTTDQETYAQIDALRLAGVVRIFEEKRSGVAHRPQLERLLYCLPRGSTVVIYRVDRLARSIRDLLRIVDRLDKAGVAIRSLTEPIDTATPMGRMFLHLLGVLAEFERSVIRERCAAGRASALARGVRFGRPRRLDYGEVRRLLDDGRSTAEVAALLGCDRSTVAHLAAAWRRGMPGPYVPVAVRSASQR